MSSAVRVIGSAATTSVPPGTSMPTRPRRCARRDGPRAEGRRQLASKLASSSCGSFPLSRGRPCIRRSAHGSAGYAVRILGACPALPSRCSSRLPCYPSSHPSHPGRSPVQPGRRSTGRRSPSTQVTTAATGLTPRRSTGWSTPARCARPATRRERRRLRATRSRPSPWTWRCGCGGSSARRARTSSSRASVERRLGPVHHRARGDRQPRARGRRRLDPCRRRSVVRPRLPRHLPAADPRPDGRHRAAVEVPRARDAARVPGRHRGSPTRRISAETASPCGRTSAGSTSPTCPRCSSRPGTCGIGADAALLESPRFRERIARSIAAGLARFLSRCCLSYFERGMKLIAPDVSSTAHRTSEIESISFSRA